VAVAPLLAVIAPFARFACPVDKTCPVDKSRAICSSKNCNENSKAMMATMAKIRVRRGVNKLGERRFITWVESATRVVASSI